MKKTFTLFLMMYAVTVTVITAETGNILLGLKLGIIAATIKTLVAKIHNWIHKDEINQDAHDENLDYHI